MSSIKHRIFKQSISSAAVLSLSTLFAGAAFGATADGSLGSTSTGTVDITATVSDYVKVTGLVANGTMAFGNITGATTDQTQTASICVYRTDNVNYDVTLTGDGGADAANDFQLQNTTTGLSADDLNYTVRFSDDSGSTYTSVTTNTALTTPDNANTSSVSCGGGTNARIEVTISSANVNSATVGSYSGTLTVLVGPGS